MHVGLGNALLILSVLATMLVVAAPVVHSSRGRHYRSAKARSRDALMPAEGDDMTRSPRLTRTPEFITNHIDHQVPKLEGALR